MIDETGLRIIRVQLKMDNAEEHSVSLTIKDKSLLSARNKIKFLFDSLQSVQDFAEIKVYV